MHRNITILIFISLFLAIDWYLFSGIKQLTREWNPNLQKTIAWLFWSIPFISISLFYSTFYLLAEKLAFQTKTFVASFILLFYLSKIFSTIILLFGDILRLGTISYNWVSDLLSNSPNDFSQSNLPAISRSQFITQASLAIGATHLGLMTWGIISGAHDYRVRRIPMILPNLPKQFHGLKLIQISDIHSGSFFNKTAVSGGIDMIENERPDLVFFTGDLVNNKAEEIREYFDIFKRIKAPLGVYSTLGNHDYGDYVNWPSKAAKQQNINDILQAHKLLNWKLLLDENKTIKVDGESIGILGIQNWGAGFAQYGNLEKALANTSELPVKLLLSHDPTHWRHQVLNKTSVDVSFAGHTHGMQYGVEIGDFKWSPAQFRYKEWAGLYKEDSQQLYVNRGYGYLGYPGRLGILPEISVFELLKG